MRRRSGDAGADAGRVDWRDHAQGIGADDRSPSGGTSLNTRNPTLVLRPSLGTYASPSVSYEVQVLTTGGDAVYSRTICGGPANGQGTLSHLVDSPLNVRTSYRWRARAVSGSAAGPWSDAASGAVMFVTNTLTPGSSNAEFRDYFFSLTVQKNLTFPSQEAFVAMDADLVAVGIIVAKDSSGFIRGRIYLPTGGADNTPARSTSLPASDQGSAGRGTCAARPSAKGFARSHSGLARLWVIVEPKRPLQSALFVVWRVAQPSV